MTGIRRTGRWRGVVVVTLVAVAVGVLAKRPFVLLAGVVGVAFTLYPRLVGAPDPELSLERSLDVASPTPGERVEVTVTVTNEGDRILPDVRIVDGVPPMLQPVEGTARHAAVLRPGRSTSFSYHLEAAYGVHRFEPATVVVRDLSGATELETEVAADTELTCGGDAPAAPLRDQTPPFPGRVVTDTGGSGIEFQGVRTYRPGDPLGRIDWNRFARSGDLATVQFRQERVASVVLCVDAREAAYVGRPDEPHAVAYCVAAAERLLSSLLEAHDQVGLAAIGREPCWFPPGAGTEHEWRARRLLATHPGFSLRPWEGAADAEAQLDELRAHLGGNTQVLFLSPLVDSFAARVATTLEVDGHAVTVLSPDVTGRTSPGDRLVALERANNVSTLREGSVPVIDWDPEVALGAVITRAKEGPRAVP